MDFEKEWNTGGESIYYKCGVRKLCIDDGGYTDYIKRNLAL